MYYSGKNILIAGCGVSGRAAARLAAFLNLDYSLFDEKSFPELDAFADSLPAPPAQRFFGAGKDTVLPLFDVLVLSPGFRKTNPLYPLLMDHAEIVTGELEFALNLCGRPYLAITGTNGKTTTTELTAALACAAGLRAKACGNNGYAMSDAAIDCLRGELDLPIVEVSSFQLESMQVPHPCSAAVLNLASDHIDRHGSMEAYAAAKFKLLRDPGTKCVVNANLARETAEYLPNRSGITTFSSAMPADFALENGSLCLHGKPFLAQNDMKLAGLHNMENALAAMSLLASVCGEQVVENESVLRALAGFTSGEHRLELFLTHDGVRYINDSKATNPHAVNAALRALGGNRRTILLLGGLDKDMQFAELLDSVQYIKCAFLFGSCADRIRDAIGARIDCTMCTGFDDAVQSAVRAAVPGDAVALSPATASMDMFKDYRDRGNQFKELVRSLLKL